MTAENFFLYIIVFLYGIIIGSFLNVCIYRIPKGESIVTVGSHCMECGHPLKWYDLFPLFSFLFLRGKCRYCGTKLSFQYPLIEAFNGVLYVWTFAAKGFGVESVLFCLLFSDLLVLSVIDLRTMKIPFAGELFVLLIGMIVTVLHYKDWMNYILGFVFCGGFLLIISVLFFLLRHKNGLGLGDIELMAFAGLCLGFFPGLFAIVIGSVSGVFVEICKILKTKKNGRFPLVPYLSAGIFFAALYGQSFYDWYLHLVL